MSVTTACIDLHGECVLIILKFGASTTACEFEDSITVQYAGYACDQNHYIGAIYINYIIYNNIYIIKCLNLAVTVTATFSLHILYGHEAMEKLWDSP